jgi:hypothetical protein
MYITINKRQITVEWKGAEGLKIPLCFISKNEKIARAKAEKYGRVYGAYMILHCNNRDYMQRISNMEGDVSMYEMVCLYTPCEIMEGNYHNEALQSAGIYTLDQLVDKYNDVSYCTKIVDMWLAGTFHYHTLILWDIYKFYPVKKACEHVFLSLMYICYGLEEKEGKTVYKQLSTATKKSIEKGIEKRINQEKKLIMEGIEK